MTDPNMAPEDWAKPPPAGTILPDGSAFFTAEYPLPADHWLYEKQAAPPEPILTHRLHKEVITAARYAIRDTTANGQIKDFDPDAMVQNIILAICGRYSTCKVAP